MSATVTLTSSVVGATTAFASAATSETVILSADATYDRRIYAIAATNSATQTPTVTLKVHDNSNGGGLNGTPVFGAIVTLATGINVMTDIFGNSALASVFQKQRDSNGAYYFNLPKGWCITAQLSANTTNNIYINVAGETYA